MFKVLCWVSGVLSLLFALNLYAMGCGSDADCAKWAANTCACGVSARCNGLTAQNQTGNCMCFGAEGHCDKTADDTKTESAKDAYVAPARGLPARRAVPVRRGAVRSGNVDVDVSH